jgi:hypothetical protein
MRLTLILNVFQTMVLTRAIVYKGPKETSVANDIPSEIGWSPKPTSIIPLGALIDQHNGRNIRRQINSDSGTCGYVSGQADLPLTCGPGSACVFETPFYFGCCSTYGTEFLAGCLTYTGCHDYSTASICTGECYYNNRVWYVTPDPLRFH